MRRETNRWLEVIIPLHVGEEISGGVRVVSSLDGGPRLSGQEEESGLHPDLFQHPHHPDHDNTPLREIGGSSDSETGGGHVQGGEG